MANYPTFARGWLRAGSQVDRDGGIIVDIAEDGTTRTRATYAVDKRTFKLVHIGPQAERDALLTHWNANKSLSFTAVHPQTGENITVRYIGIGGVDQPNTENNDYKMTVQLREA